jgi:hemoglobin-like flavoprotein
MGIRKWLGLEDEMTDPNRETEDLSEALPPGEQYATGPHVEHFTPDAVNQSAELADALPYARRVDQALREAREAQVEQARATITGARADDAYFDDSQQTSFAQAGDRLEEMTSTAERRYMGVPGLTPAAAPAEHQPDDDGERCEVCGQKIPTDHDLLAEVLGWLGTDGGDELVRRFYIRLFEVAPDLRTLFPDDITIQEEKLLSGIVSLLQLFKAGDDQMEALDSALAKFGRSHTRFDPAATIEEYAAVKGVLFEVAAGMLGDKLTPRHVAALTRAYEYAAGMMLAAQATAKLSGKGRRRRTV